MGIQQADEHNTRESGVLDAVCQQVSRVIVGHTALIDRSLTALWCNGHVLIEGVSGLARTFVVTTLAQALHATFHRVQFKPDLLPGDLIGTLIFNPKTGEFTPRKGPIFCNLSLKLQSVASTQA